MDGEHTIYELAGGDAAFEALVERFYAYVEQDAALRPMFPDDLEPGKRYQYLFLTQFFGGPARYGDERGHPRLRMRHYPFPIDSEAQKRWLKHMLQAIDDVGIPEPARTSMREYFENGSRFLINRTNPEQADGQ
ncbi:MAG: globin [Chloroflexi bacterium]|nr:globin [Chloroflexota bacterium]